jgi:DNA ligase-1
MVYEIIQEVRDTSSTTKKKEILQTHINNETLKQLFLYAYNPYINYYVRKVESTPYSKTPRQEQNIEDMFCVLGMLLDRKVTGNAAKNLVNNFVEKTDSHTADLLEKILQRDLDCGVGISTINSVWTNLVPKFTCMLAEKGEPTFPCIAEEKYDGVRFICMIDDMGEPTFYTRNGNVADFDVLSEQIKSLQIHNIVLDGEVTGKDRQSVSGLVNKYLKGTATKNLDKDFVYNIFDCMAKIDWCSENMLPFNTRHQDLIEIVGLKLDDKYHLNLSLAESRFCDTQEDIDMFYQEVISKGGEGLILKQPTHNYEWKRSKSWLKIKAEETIELRVQSLIPGKGKREGGVGSLLCVSDCDAVEVQVGSGLKDNDVDYINTNDVIGKIIEVKYNSIIQSKNKNTYSLFLPRFVKFRFDKDETDTIFK